MQQTTTRTSTIKPRVSTLPCSRSSVLLSCFCSSALLLFCACFNIPSFPDQKEVKDLRILAIKADPPLVAPGGGTELAAFVVDQEGPVTGAAHRWWWCGRISGSEGSAGCDPEDDGAEVFGTADRVPYTTPEEVLDKDNVVVERYGFRDVVNLEVARGNEQVRSFKRLQIQRGTENRNPIITGIIIEGASTQGGAFVVAPDRKYPVYPVTSGGRETFTVKDFVGATVPLAEIYEYSWYATGGKLSDSVTVETRRTATHWETPEAAPADGKPLWIYTVVYDGRGGTDWWAQKVYVEE